MYRRTLAAISAVGLVAAALVVSLTTPASSGTFPGANAKIAFAAKADQQSNRNIYTVNPDGSGLTRLSTSTDREQYPSWSADGSKIAFSVDNRGNPGSIGVMNADGSGRTIIYTDPADYIDEVSFSPDGSKIAFSTSGGPVVIGVVNADGTGRITIATGHSAPQWSPDGTKIGAVGPSGIVLMNADGSGVTTIPSTTNAESVCFSADGTKVTYSAVVSGVSQIFAANIDGSGQVQISADPTVNAFGQCFSPDGTKIAYTQNGAVITANADGSGGYATLVTASSQSFNVSWAATPLAPSPTPDPSGPSAPKFTG